MRQLLASSGIEDYCWSLVSEETAGPNRFLVNRGGEAWLSKLNGLRTELHQLMELYGLLATLHQKRVDTATELLAAQGLLVLTPGPVLRPHTPEWFAALEVWNPAQAAMTRAVIDKMGSADVCSVCGDDPAKDYRLEEGYRPPGGADTLRHCDDCVEIRRSMGDPFLPL